jgi:sec-independent protein translocase protein TatB
MFDVGFWELAMIAVVALLVVGPERLPKLARTAGLWLGKGRRFIGSVKADIDREMRAEELKQILDKQAHSNPLEEIVEDTRGAVRELEEGVKAGAEAAAKPEPGKPDDAK